MQTTTTTNTYQIVALDGVTAFMALKVNSLVNSHFRTYVLFYATSPVLIGSALGPAPPHSRSCRPFAHAFVIRIER